jgi:hypothetical protein
MIGYLNAASGGKRQLSPADHAFDGGNERGLIERLEQVLGAGRAEPLPAALIMVRRDDDRGNVEACAQELAMKLEAVHLRHLKVQDQAFGPHIRKRLEELTCGWVSLWLEVACVQQSGQCRSHGSIVIHDRYIWKL